LVRYSPSQGYRPRSEGICRLYTPPFKDNRRCIQAELAYVIGALARLNGLVCAGAQPPHVAEVLQDELRGFARLAAAPPITLDPWVTENLASLGAQAARAPAALAGQGLVHSDIRTDNILIAPDSTVVIIDGSSNLRGK
jgi:hypothetical protein